MIALTVLVPVETVSTLNRREHWGARAKRSQTQRMAAYGQVRSSANKAGLRVGAGGAVVTLTRICQPRRKIRDDDNLAAALKSVRDGVAQALGADDSMSGGLSWRYAQRAVRDAAPGVLVEVEVPSARD